MKNQANTDAANSAKLCGGNALLQRVETDIAKAIVELSKTRPQTRCDRVLYFRIRRRGGMYVRYTL